MYDPEIGMRLHVGKFFDWESESHDDDRRLTYGDHGFVAEIYCDNAGPRTFSPCHLVLTFVDPGGDWIDWDGFDEFQHGYASFDDAEAAAHAAQAKWMGPNAVREANDSE